MNRGTWPVFTIGLVTLLLLILIPGAETIRHTDRIQKEIRNIQGGFQEREQALQEIGTRIHVVSIVVRDFLLDSSAENGEQYRQELVANRRRIEEQLGRLAVQGGPEDAGPLGRLGTQLEVYWSTVMPVFAWSPAEKAARAAYFLRQQQRPRRENLLAITTEIARLNRGSYTRQYARLEESLRELRDGAERRLQIAAWLGVIVAVATVLRIALLERRNRAHQKAMAEAEQRARDLSARLIVAQEEERRSLSRELHDEVGQMLTGLRMELGALERGRLQEESFRGHVHEAKHLAESTMRTIRDLARGLRPSALDDLGLEAAIRLQAREFSRRTGKSIRVEVGEDPGVLLDAHRTCLYRVFQEALTNAVKHSGASEVVVGLGRSGDEITLTIADNGCGIDPQASGQGLGLLGMEERVRELHGSLRVHSEPGKGTRIHVRVPLARGVAA